MRHINKETKVEAIQEKHKTEIENKIEEKLKQGYEIKSVHSTRDEDGIALWRALLVKTTYTTEYTIEDEDDTQ